ncbi:hypothetical protein, partial [Thauera propionica]|uniref:hypothetical protein n=1 Tax=Thauera propionica TaxID=2019431 RepID=UPI0023EF5F78
LHDEAGLTDMAPDTSLRDDLMDVTADAMRQIRAFLLRYVDAVQHPDSIAGLHLELTLDLHPSPKLDAVIARMRVCSSASVVPNASSPKRSAEITRMPYSGYGKPRQPCRTDGDLLFAGLIGLALGIYLGGD